LRTLGNGNRNFIMLSRFVWFLLVGMGGAALALQVAWNARLRAATGSAVLTTIISVLITIVALALVWVSGLTSRGSIPSFQSLPKWAWCGGLCAAYYLVASLVALPRLGAAAVFCLVIAGQMITAVLLDSSGAFNVAKISLTPSRIAGTILLLAGVVLIQKR
jgi:transporter family-2 protein